MKGNEEVRHLLEEKIEQHQMLLLNKEYVINPIQVREELEQYRLVYREFFSQSKP